MTVRPRARLSAVLRPAVLLFLPFTLFACAPKRLALPTGAGVPFPDFAAAYAQATAECRTVKTLSASLALSGHAGRSKLRGRIDAGFAEPSRIRLEGFPPVMFGGKPLFVLVAAKDEATLVLPRDQRVLRGAPPAAVVEALAGVALTPSELRAIVAGCGLGSGDPSAGRSFANGWAAVDAGEATAFLRQVNGKWRVVAASRPALTVEYSNLTAAAYPGSVRVRAGAAGDAGTDFTLRLSQVEINVPLDDRVFEVEVPQASAPITLEELRRAGPLGEPARR